MIVINLERQNRKKQENKIGLLNYPEFFNFLCHVFPPILLPKTKNNQDFPSQIRLQGKFVIFTHNPLSVDQNLYPIAICFPTVFFSLFKEIEAYNSLK